MNVQTQTRASSVALPWHGVGSQLSPQQPIERWAREAGMDWQIMQSPVRYQTNHGDNYEEVRVFPEQKVLFRSDTHEPLSVVSKRYQIVQPREVLEFYRDLSEVSGFKLETAGVLRHGKKFWALAKTGQHTVFKGNDQVNGYLLLATSCDGTLATTATPTTIRVVCSNTLNIALNGAVGAIKVPHNTTFDAKAVKVQLGIAVSSWDIFINQMKALTERKVKDVEALRFMLTVFDGPNPQPGANINERAIKQVHELFNGKGKGAEMQSSQGTAWGLLNSVTEFVDHHRRTRSVDHRLDSSWFGQGATIKQRALNSALALI